MKSHRKLPYLPPVLMIVFLMIFAPLMSGCSIYSTLQKTTRKITRNITGPGGSQRKIVGIAVFDNKTFLNSASFERIFQRNLNANLAKACPDILTIKPGDPAYPDFMAKLPRLPSGKIDNFALATFARKIGMNAVVTGSLTGVKVSQKMEGFWFKELQHTILLSVVIEVYDTETGAKLTDERFVQEVEVDEVEVEAIEARKAGVSTVIENALVKITDPVVEKICEDIDDQPWKGFVVSVSGNNIVLSSGKATGLAPGNILEVYNSAYVIQGAGGQKFFLPGLKSGEIRITAVFTNRAEAVKISGESIKAGSTVKPK